MTRRTQGDADSGVTSIAPTAKIMPKIKCAIPRARHFHIAAPRDGLCQRIQTERILDD